MFYKMKTFIGMAKMRVGNLSYVIIYCAATWLFVMWRTW